MLNNHLTSQILGLCLKFLENIINQRTDFRSFVKDHQMAASFDPKNGGLNAFEGKGLIFGTM